MGLIPLFDNTKKLVDKQIREDRTFGVIPQLTAKALRLLFDVIAELLGMVAIPVVLLTVLALARALDPSATGSGSAAMACHPTDSRDGSWPQPQRTTSLGPATRAARCSSSTFMTLLN